MTTLAETIRETQKLRREQRDEYMKEFNASFATALAKRIKAKLISVPFLFGGFHVVLYSEGECSLLFTDVAQMLHGDNVPIEYPLTVVVDGETCGGIGSPVRLSYETLVGVGDALACILKESYGFENISARGGLYGVMLEIRL